jgi:hypothetical protein
MIDSIGTNHNPTSGINAIPCTGVRNCNTPQMNIKEVLAENLKALMQANPRLDTLPKITAASDGRLSNGKLDRIRRAAVATDIDAVSELAEVFGVAPGALLLEEAGDLRASSAPPDDPTQVTTAKLTAALSVLQTAIERSDAPTRLALEPLFSALVRSRSKSANSSHLIVKLLAEPEPLVKNPGKVGGDISRVVLPTGGFVGHGTSNTAKKKRG